MFKKIKDKNIFLCFKKCCDCDIIPEVVELPPSDIVICGTPICGECDTEMEYTHAEVNLEA